MNAGTLSCMHAAVCSGRLCTVSQPPMHSHRILLSHAVMRACMQRLRREVEYHKRLRLGADQRAYELEERLRQQRRQTSTFDEAQV